MSLREFLLAPFLAAICFSACSPPSNPAGDASLDAAVDANADSTVDVADVVRSDDGSNLCVMDQDCSDDVFCNGAERCQPGAAGADERGCLASPTSPCLADQTCDETSRRCVRPCALTGDADGDGVLSVECGGGDCDDHDPNRFPGNREYCDPMAPDHDEDCDGGTYGLRDHDMDGFGDAVCCNVATSGARTCGNDCDDNNPGVHPGLAETCDGVDNNCDGMTDEGVRQMLWPDADGDLFGDMAATPIDGCPALNPGRVTNGTDCNDAAVGVHPGQTETCNSIDDDCNAMIDEGTRASCYVDSDGDGYATAGATRMDVCAAGGGCPTGFTARMPAGAGSTDCDDTTPSRNPAVVETCNSVDDNCNGLVDDNVPSTCYLDSDGDGYAAMGAATRMGSCGVCPTGYTNRAPVDSLTTDCRDNAANVNPGSVELCNRLDDNCSTGGGVDTSEDADNDGFAATGAACTGGTLPKTDCGDTDANVHPGQTMYFTTPRADVPATAPNAYDYDCSNTSDPQYTTTVQCTNYGGSCGCGVSTSGWASTIPACGASAPFGRCDFCTCAGLPSTAQTQPCR